MLYIPPGVDNVVSRLWWTHGILMTGRLFFRLCPRNYVNNKMKTAEGTSATMKDTPSFICSRMLVVLGCKSEYGVWILLVRVLLIMKRLSTMAMFLANYPIAMTYTSQCRRQHCIKYIFESQKLYNITSFPVCMWYWCCCTLAHRSLDLQRFRARAYRAICDSLRVFDIGPSDIDYSLSLPAPHLGA